MSLQENTELQMTIADGPKTVLVGNVFFFKFNLPTEKFVGNLAITFFVGLVTAILQIVLQRKMSSIIS